MDKGSTVLDARRVEAQARESRPPDAVMRWLNPVLRWLLLSPAGRLVSGLAVLEVTGRKTGHTYRVVAGWHRVQDMEFAVTPARWRQNFEAMAPLLVTHRDRTRRGVGRLDEDPKAVAAALRQLMSHGTSARALGMVVRDGHAFTSADAVATRKALVYFEPWPGEVAIRSCPAHAHPPRPVDMSGPITTSAAQDRREARADACAGPVPVR